MLIIIGFVVVLGAVLGGFLMAGGTIAVLIQPSEFVVIGGAAVGSLLISTPPKVCRFSHTMMFGWRVANSITARVSGALPG